MTIDEFHAQPNRPGWKYEYRGGKAYIQPRPSVAVLRAPVVVRPVAVPDSFRLRPATVADSAFLIHAFFDAFRDSIDYWDSRQPAIRADSRKSIETCFAGRRGAFHAASFVAVAPTGRSLAGAALLVEEGDGPALDLMFVRPRWQWLGLGLALAQAAMNALHESGAAHLGGAYNVANDASAALHQRLGFQELPDLRRAQEEAEGARHELWRRERAGDLARAEWKELKQVAAHWGKVCGELCALCDRDGHEAVSPLLRRRRAREEKIL